MSEETTTDEAAFEEYPRRSMRGRPKKNHGISRSSPRFKAKRTSLEIGEAARSKLAGLAKQRGLSLGDMARDIILQEGDAVTLPQSVMDRLTRNAPSGASPSRYAEHLIIEALNQRGEI